ncbi:hypothetical protein D1007_23097 [Hordeum vulgare]|nr:hypothetical protein D1007_23097 [Hordeum vulgare]
MRVVLGGGFLTRTSGNGLEGNSAGLVKTAYPFFLHNIYAGLVSLFSNFFYTILSRYQIHALHLQPNSVLLLAIFAFYIKAFMGMRPSVAHFRHFFSLRFTTSSQRCVCISFVDVAGTGTHLKAGEKVEGYRYHFVFMDVCRESLLVATLTGPSEQTSGWSHKKLTDSRVEPVLDHIAALVEARFRRSCAPCGSSLVRGNQGTYIMPPAIKKKRKWAARDD